MSAEQLIDELAVAFALVGGDASAPVLAAMARELGQFPPDVALAAVRQTARECRGRITLADLLMRAEAADGRPEPNEAWAIAVRAAPEAATVVWTEEIRRAWFAVSDFYRLDRIAARLAFIERYKALVAEARRGREPVGWVISLGHDATGRATAIDEAVAAGRIGAETGERLKLSAPEAAPMGLALAIQGVVKRLPGGR